MPEFIQSWWENLNFDLQVFYGIAVISLFALIFQTIITFIVGLDDVDIGDAAGNDSGIGIFSVRGFTAFFIGFGWTGVICTKQGLSLPVTILISVVVGTVMMIAIYLMMRSFMRLQDSGTLNYKNAVGEIGTTYVTIPPANQAGGQIEAMIQGRFVTAEAIQKGTEPITPGTKIRILEQIGTGTFIVEPVS